MRKVTDFQDYEHWRQLAKARGFRLPRSETKYGSRKITSWLNRLGMPVSDFLVWGGFKSVGDWNRLNPDWPLSALLGLLMEHQEVGNVSQVVCDDLGVMYASSKLDERPK